MQKIPKYKHDNAKLQMEQNTNRTKCKNSKIQIRQNFKPHYILPLPNGGTVVHALMYWPNVGAFGLSDDLEYTSTRTNVKHASIVAHAT